MTLYLLRSHTLLNIVFDVFFALSLSIGGWLLARKAFRLRPAERFAVGLATGLMLDIFFINLLGHILPVIWAFWLGPGLVLTLGLWAGWPWKNLRVPRAEWRAALTQIITLLAVTVLLWGMQRGMYISDDYFHLPLLSTLAAGNFPPQFHLNAAIQLDYHYALHLLAGGLVRWGGFTIWGIWDGVRALIIALTLQLVWLWGKRITRSSNGAWALTLLFSFGSGTRWLLLLFPQSVVSRMGARLTLFGTSAATGPDLLTNLTRPWAIGGMSPLNVPFAYTNGFWYPVTMAWGGSSSLTLMGLVLLLLVYPRRRMSSVTALLFTILLTTYALISEYIYLFILLGMGLLWTGWLWQFLRHKEQHWLGLLRQWAALAAASLLLAVLQGGVLGGLISSIFAPPQSESQRFGFSGFSFRWPPALVSGHLGPLSLADPWQMLLAVTEIGPVLLLIPFLVVFLWRWLHHTERTHLEAALSIGALFGFIVPMFLRYGMERDQARLFTVLITVSLLLAAPRVWQIAITWRDVRRIFFWGAYGIILFAGVVLFALQLLSWKTPLLSEFIAPADARMSRQIWDTLPDDALILDRTPPRGVTVTGRLTRSSVTTYQTLPEWDDLIADLSPQRAAAQGFDFIYMDGNWWNDLNAARDKFMANCVIMDLPENPFAGNTRWLIDIRGCR